MSDPKQEWDNLTQSEQLYSIYAELRLLREAITDTENPTQEPMYECERCGTRVDKSERKAHAIEQHKAPPEMLDSLFTRLIE